MLITGYYQLARKRMCWEQENDVLNSAVPDLIVQNCFDKIIGYLAGNFNLDKNENLVRLLHSTIS